MLKLASAMPRSFLSTLKADFFSSAQTGLEAAPLAGLPSWRKGGIECGVFGPAYRPCDPCPTRVRRYHSQNRAIPSRNDVAGS